MDSPVTARTMRLRWNGEQPAARPIAASVSRSGRTAANDLLHCRGVFQRLPPRRSPEGGRSCGAAIAVGAGEGECRVEKPERGFLLLHRLGPSPRRAHGQPVQEVLAAAERRLAEREPQGRTLLFGGIHHAQHFPQRLHGAPKDRAGVATRHRMTDPVDLADAGEHQRPRGDQRRRPVHLADERPLPDHDDLIGVVVLLLMGRSVAARAAPVEHPDGVTPVRAAGRTACGAGFWKR